MPMAPLPARDLPTLSEERKEVLFGRRDDRTPSVRTDEPIEYGALAR